MDNQPNAKLLDNALEALRPLGLRWTMLAREPQLGLERADALVRLHFGGLDTDYVVDIKRNLRPYTVGLALQKLAGFRGKKLLVTDHMTPAMADELRARGAEFIDAAGNAYLNEPPMLVWVKGQRPPDRPTAADQKGRAFQTTGLRVLFTLLCNPKAVNLPYREIAAMAGVAHGTVGWVMPELPRLGFMVEINNTRRLVDTTRLLKEWVEAYIRKLRPKLLLARYKADDLEWTTTVAAENYGLLLGGEPAAYRYTAGLRPGTATFYGEVINPKLMIDFRLRPDPAGNVAVLKRFWNFEADRPGLVPEILVYADLLATGDARCLEVAEEMYGAIADRLS